MLEPMLLGVVDSPVWIDTSIPEVKAAVLRCDRGDAGAAAVARAGAQFVPGQSATPIADDHRAEGADRRAGVGRVAGRGQGAAESEAGGRRHAGDAHRVRHLGRDRVHVRQSPTAAGRLAGPGAGGWPSWPPSGATTWPAVEIDKVEKVQAQLRELGHEVPDAAGLMAKSPAVPDGGQGRRGTRKDYRDAYHDSQRAVRPLRILMRAQWEAASSRSARTPRRRPARIAVSFYTLPKHWKFRSRARAVLAGRQQAARRRFRARRPASRRLANPPGDAGRSRGGCEDHDDRAARRPALPEIADPAASRCRVDARRSARQARPPPPITALEPTYLAVTRPPVQLPPAAWCGSAAGSRWPSRSRRRPTGRCSSTRAGGEPLGVRLTERRRAGSNSRSIRRVPANGRNATDGGADRRRHRVFR